MLTALPRVLRTEVRFYNEVASSTPVLRPRLLAGKSKFGRGSMLVLSDVTEGGAHPGSPCDNLTVPQAFSVIEEIARLHSSFWNKDGLDWQYRWLARPVRRLEDRLGAVLAVPLMRRGLRRADTAISRRLHGPALAYARRRSAAMHFLSQGPRTLIHHDLHPGNLFWHHSRPGFLDWQLVRIGEGIGDVAYFLATGLSPNLRRSHELEMLARYHEVLAENGIHGLDIDHQLQRYRAHLVYAFEAMVVTLAVGGMMDTGANLELVRRTAVAVEDHDSFAIIKKALH
ncbi:MAG: aminoglycoside phosphotransferase family protein [Candidatus Binataceae bacterium]